jgi:TRAP-type C4-dicarboxylate transport system permease small subunit
MVIMIIIVAMLNLLLNLKPCFSWFYSRSAKSEYDCNLSVKGSVKLKRAIQFLTHLDINLGPVIVLLILIVVILQVLSRVLPGNAISWTVEVGEMLLGALIWLVISAGVLENAHVGFDLVTKKLSPGFKKYFGLLSNALFIGYLVILAVFTYQLLGYYCKIDSRSTILGISMFWVRMPILIGCAFTIIRLLTKEYRVLTNREKMFTAEDIEPKGDYE